MKKQTAGIAIAAGLLAIMSAPQQSFSQYGDGAQVGISDETLRKCAELEIPRTQCSEVTVLQKERVTRGLDGEGSGTAMLATETAQMIVFMGALAAIFGGVAGGFFVMGRKPKQVESA